MFSSIIRNMDIKQLISHKRALLKAAQEKVSELQQQIAMLENMASEDALDTALANKIKPTRLEWPVPMPMPVSRATLIIRPRQMATTATGRNPKGSVRDALLKILADGAVHDLDNIEKEQRAILPSPITRAAIRTTLMMLKNDGEVVSHKQGYFQLAPKK